MNVKRIVMSIIIVLFFPGNLWSADPYLEDINFPLDSRIVVDDLKQIPILAEILKRYPDLFIEINAHADRKGSQKYNLKLSLERAKAVEKTLNEHGVSSERIFIKGFGKDSPKAINDTKEGRFINRRAVFSIYTVKNGKKEYYYKDNEIVKSFPVVHAEPPMEPAKPVLAQGLMNKNELEKRFDEIEALIIESKVTEQVEKDLILDKMRGCIALAGGSDEEELTSNIEGKFFIPYYEKFALQGNLSADLGDDLKEYQFDCGIVGKQQRLQLGLFVSQKTVNLENFEDHAGLSQFSIATSFLFNKGSIGLYLTKAIHGKDVLTRELGIVNLNTIQTDTCLEIRNHWGVSFDHVFDNGLSIDGSVGHLMSSDDDIIGRLKIGYLVPVLKNKIKLFLQGFYNNGFVEDNNDITIVVGFEIGNWDLKKKAQKDLRPMHVQDVSYRLRINDKILN